MSPTISAYLREVHASIVKSRQLRNRPSPSFEEFLSECTRLGEAVRISKLGV